MVNLTENMVNDPFKIVDVFGPSLYDEVVVGFSTEELKMIESFESIDKNLKNVMNKIDSGVEISKEEYEQALKKQFKHIKLANVNNTDLKRTMFVFGKGSYSKNNFLENKKKKVYKNFVCPICRGNEIFGVRFLTRQELYDHIYYGHEKERGDEDPDKFFYDVRNPGDHLCPICHKNKREWMYDKKKYRRICYDPKCKQKYINDMKTSLKKKYGTDCPMRELYYQQMLLSSRKTSMMYNFRDGTSLNCVSTYEYDFLKHCEEKFRLTGCEIQSIYSDEQCVFYEEGGKYRRYIPDFYIPGLNLVIEIKNSCMYPIETKERDKYKEAALIKADKFNYIKIYEKNYKDFDMYMEKRLDDLIYGLNRDNYDDTKGHTIIIPDIKFHA